MALAIRPTPILKGREAKEFSEKINSNKNRPVSKEAYERTVNAFNNIKIKPGVRF